jgi:hypothetical protein
MDLLWPPLTNRCVMDLPAGVGEVEGCRHFFTNGGLGCLGGRLPAILWPDLPRLPPGGRGIFIFGSGPTPPHSLGGSCCLWLGIGADLGFLPFPVDKMTLRH